LRQSRGNYYSKGGKLVDKKERLALIRALHQALTALETIETVNETVDRLDDEIEYEIETVSERIHSVPVQF